MVKRKSKTFTIELTGEQTDALRELAGSWNDTLEEALRRIAVRGIDTELHPQHYDEREAA
jgi:hypothetical protein